jgi:HK97 family phage major capsid protein
MKIERRSREFEIRKNDIDEERRTVSLSFSSEAPVPRWGFIEILSHDPRSVRLERLRDGGALLLNHDMNDQVGVVERASIDSDRVGRAVVKFSRSTRGEEIFRDVIDGVRKKASVAYLVHKEKTEEGENGAPNVSRVIDWQPLEVSLVSVPADTTVGVGRQIEGSFLQGGFNMSDSDIRDDRELENNYARVRELRSGSLDAKGERARVREILGTAEHFKDLEGINELANEAINNGASIADFHKVVLERMGNAQRTPIFSAGTWGSASPLLGMTEREVDRYSLVRAIRAAADKDWSKAGFERECSVAAARQFHRDPQGFWIPPEIVLGDGRQQQRDLVKGTDTAGGYLVATELGPLIELLRNAMVTRMAGATVLSGLQGDLALPRQDAAGTGYWVAEGSSPTESQQTLGQVPLTPKTVGAYTDYTRKLLIQSSIDVENFVRQDLMAVVALAVDRAALIGSGSGAEPLGIAGTSGIGDVNMGDPDGAAPTWAKLVEFESDVSAANAALGRLAYIANSVTIGKLKTVEKASGTAKFLYNFEASDRPLNGYPVHVTNALRSNLSKGASGTVLSEMFFGDWRSLLIGVWSGFDVLVDPYTFGTSGGVRIVVLHDVDVAVRHAASFSYSDEIVTA